MSKANPSVPEHLDNPELARDIRALATRIEEQAHRYTLERRTNNLAALFTVGLAFNNLARDLRLIADHVQPASTPGAGGRPSSGAPAVGDGQVLRRSTPAADVECGGTLAYEVMGGAIRVHRDGVKCKYAHLFLKPRRFSAGQARWIVSDVCEGGCGLKVPQAGWVKLSSAGWRDTNAAPEGLCLQKWWCKSCAPEAGFDY